MKKLEEYVRSLSLIHILYIDMCNLDFMLFSSKIVYLLDNCPDEILPDFIHYLTEGDTNV